MPAYALEEQKKRNGFGWIKGLAPKNQKKGLDLLEELGLGESESSSLTEMNE